ncbi:MAG: hypothetical protein KIT17_24915 [Rubrivivax sp.]|nr:hypothetical protein [Rubrivivax sp.]
MTLFDTARQAHILIGTVVLASFWVAALAAKGSALHKRGGRLYVLSMAALLAATLVLAAGSALAGVPMRAVFNVYVTLISVVSVFMAWRSIASRADVHRYLDWRYKALCVLLGAYGLFLLGLALSPGMGEPARRALVACFALLGLSIAGAMAWRLRRGADHPRWWLSEHLTAMGINFAATHASFSLLAGGAVFAVLKEPWVRTGVLAAWMTSALVVRLWAGRRFLGRRTAPAGPPGERGQAAVGAAG